MGRNFHQDSRTICSPVGHSIQRIIPRLVSSLGVSVPAQNTRVDSCMAVDSIIKAIQKRQVVHRLYLEASSLDDAGCTRLFEFLASPAGLLCRENLTELVLTKNDIGAQGLLAITNFLKGDNVLRELYLSENPLTTDAHIVAEFTRAVNSSHLCTLQIHNIRSLGDSFAQVFLSHLNSPYLRDLDLSTINMTQGIVPILADYVHSHRCHLDSLICHTNNLTSTGTHTIVDGLQENYSLRNTDLRADTRILTDESDRALSALARRNTALILAVRAEALAFLRYTRALFLRSSVHAPFYRLPAELHHKIVSYLAPSLSHHQRMRIIDFASDPGTLVSGRTTCLDKGPSFWHGRSCEGTWRPPVRWQCGCPPKRRAFCGCLWTWKNEMRDIWFSRVACITRDSGF